MIAAAIVGHLVTLSIVEPPAIRAVVAAVFDDPAEPEPDRFVQHDDVWYNVTCLERVLMRRGTRTLMCSLSGGGSACRTEVAQQAALEQLGCSSVDVPAFTMVEPKPLVDEETFEVAMMDLDLPAPNASEPEPETTLVEEFQKMADPANLPRPTGQVVDIPRPLDNTPPPPDTAYVAEFDSSVEKETHKFGVPDEAGVQQRLPRTGPTTELVEPPDEIPMEGSDVTEEQLSVAEEPPADTEAGEAGGSASGESLDQERAALEPEPAPEGNADGLESSLPGIGPAWGMPKISTVPRAPLGDKVGSDKAGSGSGDADGDGDGGGEPALSDLRVTEEVLTEATSGTYDYLPGVDQGEGTALNARRWKYASFFNRVKEQVAQNWNPAYAYRLRDPNGNIYGHKNRLTVLSIALNPNGSLHKVHISKPSGVDFLDEEAIKAFQAAQPFPNPPPALVSGDTRLITFQFGFMFEINSREPWKIFRYRGR